MLNIKHMLTLKAGAQLFPFVRLHIAAFPLVPARPTSMKMAARAASFSNDEQRGIIAFGSEQFSPKRGINKARGGEKPKRVLMEAKDHGGTASAPEEMPLSGRPMFDIGCTIQSENARGDFSFSA